MNVTENICIIRQIWHKNGRNLSHSMLCTHQNKGIYSTRVKSMKKWELLVLRPLEPTKVRGTKVPSSHAQRHFGNDFESFQILLQNDSQTGYKTQSVTQFWKNMISEYYLRDYFPLTVQQLHRDTPLTLETISSHLSRTVKSSEQRIKAVAQNLLSQCNLDSKIST